MGHAAVASEVVETAYLIVLIVTFVVITVLSIYVIVKLFAGQR